MRIKWQGKSIAIVYRTSDCSDFYKKFLFLSAKVKVSKKRDGKAAGIP